MSAEKLAGLRVPFPENQISYLPKGGVKLAYVGHAALTDRLLDTDPAWSWEPLALDARGLPALDECGGLWIRLNICGITRLGYGDAGAKKGGDAMKERIGDALRNAAMRFGAALDLWHKGDLHAHAEDDTGDHNPNLSPQTRAARITDGVNEGDAEGAAAALAGFPEPEYLAVWAMLDGKTQNKLIAAWPAEMKA